MLGLKHTPPVVPFRRASTRQESQSIHYILFRINRFRLEAVAKPMAGRYLVNFVVIASVLASVHGLKCHEGIDATVSGLPVQFWTERECAGDSKCIRQEVSFSTSASGKNRSTQFRLNISLIN